MGRGPSQGSGSKTGRSVLLWLAFWLVVALVVAVVVAPREPLALAGVGGAALLSLILLLSSLGSQWEGQVAEIRQERERSGDDDGWETVTYAYVRQPSGKMRRMRAMPGWQAGDYLQKRRGDVAINKR